MKAIVTFRSLADGNVVALCDNHKGMSVDADKVREYMNKMVELTGGTDVEFNDTFRQICKDRVFFTYEPNIDVEKFYDEPSVPNVVECVLLSTDEVAMNVNGKVLVFFPEEGNKMFATKEDALQDAKEFVLGLNDTCVNELFAARAEIKNLLKSLNADIDKHLNFKKNL